MNRKEIIDGVATIKDGSEWTLTERWIDPAGEVCWYNGVQHRNGVTWQRTIDPELIVSVEVSA